MFLPILSLTLRQGSWISSLHAIRAPAPLLTLLRKTIGVFPIKSVTLFAILAPSAAGDLAGGASVAAALTCASALHTKGARMAGACLHLCSRKGYVTVLGLAYKQVLQVSLRINLTLLCKLSKQHIGQQACLVVASAAHGLGA